MRPEIILLAVKYLNQAISATNLCLTVSTSKETGNAYVQYEHIVVYQILSIQNKIKVCHKAHKKHEWHFVRRLLYWNVKCNLEGYWS
jgi:hypothetical protein